MPPGERRPVRFVVRRLSIEESLSSPGRTEAELPSSTGGVTRLGTRLLHPAALFAAVWVVGLGGWLIASPEWLLRVAGAEKDSSARAIFYFALCIGMFLFGAVVGPPLLRANERPAGILPGDLSTDEIDALRRRTYIWFGIGASSALYLLAAGTLRFGGLPSLISFVAGGGSLLVLAEGYFQPARTAGITVWVHALVAVGPLTTIAVGLVNERAVRRRLVAANIVALILVFLISLAFAERLMAFAYIVSSLVAWVGVRPFMTRARNSTFPIKTALRVVVFASLVVGLWVGGEFSRTYLAKQESSTPISVSAVGASLPFAVERFLGYATTSVNNGMYAVDHAQERGLIAETGSALVTATGFERGDAPIVGPSLVERGAMLWEIFPYHQPLTTYSMPGYVFMDLGWIAPALIFWFGVVSGCVYARFRRGELWALLVYPLIVVGILDSYRILYWTHTAMVVPVLAFTLVCASWYSARRSATSTATPPGPQPTSISLT